MFNEGIDNGAFDGQDAVAAVAGFAAGYPYTQAIPIRYVLGETLELNIWGC